MVNNETDELRRRTQSGVRAMSGFLSGVGLWVSGGRGGIVMDSTRATLARVEIIASRFLIYFENVGKKWAQFYSCCGWW